MKIKTMTTASSAEDEIGKGLNEKHTDLIVKFVSDVRRGKIEKSEKIALSTISLLEQIIADSENATVLELCSSVRAAGRMICRALPNEIVAANMVRRVLRAIRDESRAQVDQNVEVAGESLQRLVQAATVRRATLGAAATDLREPIRDHIAELVAEVESSSESICSSAHSHVHADELLLTYGASELVENFLKAAAPRGFKLIHAAGPDVNKSHAMSERLSHVGISVTVIAPEAMFAFMSRVNKRDTVTLKRAWDNLKAMARRSRAAERGNLIKTGGGPSTPPQQGAIISMVEEVVIGVRAVLAGGALLGEAGTSLATGAAHFYSVPVIALAPLYKLSPLYACGQQQFDELGPPSQVMTYQEASGVCEHVYAPLYDPVPSEHVTLFITNLGGSSPSYVYRLLSELYDPNDNQLL